MQVEQHLYFIHHYCVGLENFTTQLQMFCQITYYIAYMFWALFLLRFVFSSSCVFSGLMISAVLIKQPQTYCLVEGFGSIAIKMANIKLLLLLFLLI